MTLVSTFSVRTTKFFITFLLIGRIKGTKNLKVVDLSICPVSISATLVFIPCLADLIQDNLGKNTYSSSLLVGEKGADLLTEDLGNYHELPAGG